jgi:hypothetical protein
MGCVDFMFLFLLENGANLDSRIRVSFTVWTGVSFKGHVLEGF